MKYFQICDIITRRSYCSRSFKAIVISQIALCKIAAYIRKHVILSTKKYWVCQFVLASTIYQYGNNFRWQNWTIFTESFHHKISIRTNINNAHQLSTDLVRCRFPKQTWTRAVLSENQHERPNCQRGDWVRDFAFFFLRIQRTKFWSRRQNSFIRGDK